MFAIFDEILLNCKNKRVVMDKKRNFIHYE